ncbi:unannotated protein [freshwater metagenome]|uniref:Unannotated protein n=1 Tax=freshwater metagenome TaxID=449393 RepID=A0A6J6BMC3_9ZZZZ
MWPKCSGPVGFALTNSRFIFLPASKFEVPNFLPPVRISVTTTPWLALSKVMLINPGPAISTLLIPAGVNSLLSVKVLTITLAITPGCKFADLERANAIDVA